MRLRTTLVLAFVLLAFVQVLVVAPFAWSNLNALLERQHAARVTQAVRAVEAEQLGWREQLRRALDELVESQAIDDAKGDVVKQPPPETIVLLAQSLMKPRGLDVLVFLDATGKTLSSGHLPARIGEPTDPLFEIAHAASNAESVVGVEINTAEGLTERPAMVGVRSLVAGTQRVGVVGGILMNETRAQVLARLSGASVEMVYQGKSVARAGEMTDAFTIERVPLSPETELVLRFSNHDALETRDEVMRAVVVLAAVGLLFSVAAGIYLSRRVTGPVEALTSAAAQIARGEPGIEVRDHASSYELSTLIDTFNRMTADLKAANDRLLASERVAAWQEVARRLAHEIKNPLTPIRMSLETLLAASQREQLDPQFKRLFKDGAQAMLEEVERLRRIVDEFSQFARLPKAQLTAIDLAETASQIMALYTDHDGVSYSLESVPTLTVQGDRHQLTQVLVNLIKNAEEAVLSNGGGRIQVRVGLEHGNAYLEVTDNGPGIDASVRGRLFEPYVTSKPDGTGLGLALAQRMAHEHDGRLTVEPQVNGTAGTTFRLTLPAHSEPEPAA